MASLNAARMNFSSSISRVLDLARVERNPELRRVSLSLREKQSLYHHFGQLVRSGITFSKALESLSRTTSGASKRLISQLAASLGEGHTIADAFARQRPMVTEMEVGVVMAVERTGRLEHGFTQLSQYFGALDEARKSIVKKSAYPLFILHFGILTVGLKVLLTGGGLHAYLKTTAITFAVIYGTAAILAAIFFVLLKQGASSPAVDSFLRRVPLFGKVRRAFAISRFCATYEMQLDAGVNVLDALETAERASQSGVIRAMVVTGLPRLRSGAQPGELLAGSGDALARSAWHQQAAAIALGRGRAFPEPMVQAFCVAEESGEMESELKRLAMEYQNEGLARLETLSEWLPRIVYIGILIYVGYGIIQFYRTYLGVLEKFGE